MKYSLRGTKSKTLKLESIEWIVAGCRYISIHIFTIDSARYVGVGQFVSFHPAPTHELESKNEKTYLNKHSINFYR